MTPKPVVVLGKKVGNLTPRSIENALEGVEAIEFSLSGYRDQRIPTIPERSNTDSDNNLLVSYPVYTITIPIKLNVPSGAQGKVSALLNLGCPRYIVSSEVVEKLGLRFQQLGVPIAFCQLDRTIAGGALAHFIIELVEM